MISYCFVFFPQVNEEEYPIYFAFSVLLKIDSELCLVFYISRYYQQPMFPCQKHTVDPSHGAVLHLVQRKHKVSFMYSSIDWRSYWSIIMNFAFKLQPCMREFT